MSEPNDAHTPKTAEGRPSFPSTPARSTMPNWYPELLTSVAERVSTGQIRASTAINRELVQTYWNIGRDILGRQNEEGWGTRVIDRLSADLREEFPKARGFSPRNLKYMRAFAEAWPDEAIMQPVVAQLPWAHNVVLVEKLGSPSERLWYAGRAAKEGWTRRFLAHQIETKLYQREGRAITNFSTTLPPSDSNMAQQMTRDPYIFDFLSMTEQHDERELESQLTDHVQKFLLELGQGFAFVGQQVRLAIGGEEFFADLLFYNFKVRSFVVIELKAGKFDPGYVGKLGVYMAAVDDLLAGDGDKPTIGLVLCKTKNDVVAEYALRGFKSPMGIAEWETEIVESLPEEFASTLPSIEDLEAELMERDSGSSSHENREDQ